MRLKQSNQNCVFKREYTPSTVRTKLRNMQCQLFLETAVWAQRALFKDSPFELTIPIRPYTVIRLRPILPESVIIIEQLLPPIVFF